MISIVFAYFDPGAGSLLLQAIVGGSAGLLVFAKFVWDSVWPRFYSERQETVLPRQASEPN